MKLVPIVNLTVAGALIGTAIMEIQGGSPIGAMFQLALVGFNVGCAVDFWVGRIVDSSEEFTSESEEDAR